MAFIGLWSHIFYIYFTMAYIMNRKRQALKESVVTVGTGLVINWPISVVLLYVFIDILALSTFMVSVWLTLCFTLIAVIRVYLIRMFFTRDENKKD